jgi:hypothetical protein
MPRRSKFCQLTFAKAMKKAPKGPPQLNSTTRELAELDAWLICTNVSLTTTKQIVRKTHTNIRDISSHVDSFPRSGNNTNAFLKEAEEKLDLVLRNGYAPQTNKNYSYAVRRFIEFSAKCGIPTANALPADPRIVSLFIASGVGVTSESAAKGNLSAIAAWHRINGFPFDTPSQVAIIKKGIRAMWPGEKQKKAPRKPISPGL